MKTQIIIHQTHHTLADFDEIFTYTTQALSGEGLHVFPELYLTGYPLQDLVLQRAFVESYQNLLSDLNDWLKKQKDTGWRALVGGIEYDIEENGTPKHIRNVILEFIPGIGMKKLYTKRLLPNYDIFDEAKYFIPGDENAFYDFHGDLFGLQICEDMWASSFHKMDPCELMLKEVKEKSLRLKAVINLSASPFEATKIEKRFQRAQNISLMFGCPFIYVNRVGGEDEILFDGTSFVQSGSQTLARLKSFEAETKVVELDQLGPYSEKPEFRYENTWEGLFAPRLEMKKPLPKVRPWSDEECQEVFQALCFGLQEYASKSGFNKFLVALSGGMDSALVLALVKLALKPGQSVEAIYMPSIHSATLSTELCEEMCRRIGIPLAYLPIKFLHSVVANTFAQSFADKFEGLVDENVQSRLRGTLLYTRSNQTGAMVINTSNKSELAVGYSTQYGDSVGAISMLGDLYKSEVYQLAEFINLRYGELIPDGIIHRGPSAELRADQLDQDSLPPYDRLDAILEGILSYHLGKKQLLEMGFAEEEVTKVLHLYSKSEYKRFQFCPILKVKAKSFGFGYRIPMTKNPDFQF